MKFGEYHLFLWHSICFDRRPCQTDTYALQSRRWRSLHTVLRIRLPHHEIHVHYEIMDLFYEPRAARKLPLLAYNNEHLAGGRDRSTSHLQTNFSLDKNIIAQKSMEPESHMTQALTMATHITPASKTTILAPSQRIPRTTGPQPPRRPCCSDDPALCHPVFFTDRLWKPGPRPGPLGVSATAMPAEAQPAFSPVAFGYVLREAGDGQTAAESGMQAGLVVASRL